MEEGKTIQGRGRQRRIVIVLVVCVLVAIGAVPFWPGERQPEPKYNGKKLSDWLEICRQHAWPDSDVSSAEDAVRSIGTNALPLLVKWMNYDEPAWQDKLFQSRYYRYVPKFVTYYMVKPIQQHRHAQIGFQILGPTAGPAAPDLARILDNYPKMSWAQALVALRGLGADAFPPLYVVATNRAKPLQIRREAMSSIGMLNSLGASTNEASVVQAILPYLSEEEMAEPTARALGAMPMLPDVCVPALRKATDSKSPEVRVWAVVALGRFGRDAQQAIPELTRAIVDTDARVRQEAMDALEKIRPETGVTNGTKGL